MAEQTKRVSGFEPLSALWRALAATRTLLILMGLLAVTLAAGNWIPQMPAGYAGNPQAWLAMQPGIWGRASGFLHSLGVFDLYGSFWFRALLVLSGLCLFVRAADSGELAWRASRRERWTQARFSAWGAQAPQLQVPLPLPLDQAVERLGALLSGHGFRWDAVPDSAVPGFVAVRRGLALWARPMAYGALLFSLVCLAVTCAWGWQGEPWQPREGDVQAVGRDSPYAVRLDAFTLMQGGGQSAEYTSRVTWLEGENELRQDVVGAGRTSKHGGITLRQVGYVPIVRMRGRGSDERPLMLETEGDVLSMTGEAEIRFASQEDQPLVLIPTQDLFLELSFEPACDGQGPALQISRIGEGGDEREVLGTLNDSGSVSVDGNRFEVDLAFAPILRLEHYPAAGLALIGLALVIVALIAYWLAPPRLAWIAIAPEQERHSLVRVLALPGYGAERWLSQVADWLQEVRSDDA